MDNDNLMSYQDELDRITKSGRTRSIDYADAEQIYESMKDLKRILLSEKYLQSKDEDNVTDKYAENKALASEEFKKFVEALNGYRKTYLKMKRDDEAYVRRYEALRTLISLEKEKMGMR